jgi:hypothetical protein
LGEIRIERDTTRKPDSLNVHLVNHQHHHLSNLGFRGEKKSRQIGDRKMSSLFINRTASMVMSSHPLLLY